MQTRTGRAPELQKGCYAMRTLINSLVLIAVFATVVTPATAQTTAAPAAGVMVCPAPMPGQMIVCQPAPAPTPVQQCCFGQSTPVPSFDQQVEDIIKREAALNKLRDAAPSAQIPWMAMLPWLGLFGILVYSFSRRFPVRTVSLRGVPVTVGPIPAVRPAAGRFCGHCGHGPAPAAANNCTSCGNVL